MSLCRFSFLRKIACKCILNGMNAGSSALRCKSTCGGKKGGGGSLREVLAGKIVTERERLKKFGKEHADAVVGEINVGMILGGMRGIKGLLSQVSTLSPEAGINFRGIEIPQLKDKLPRAECSEMPLPESVFWLLLSGEVPTPEQVKQLSAEWVERAPLPEYVTNMLNNMPPSMHPMLQLSCAVTALSECSKYRKAYADGVKKDVYWETTYEDTMDLIAKLPVIAAIIYNNAYRGGNTDTKLEDTDWSKNFAKMLGYDDPEFTELMRLYLVIHSDHGGGNVSTHATRLINSALSDPYLSFAGGLNGLAGPLHGLANQEVLVWLMKLQKEVGEDPSEEQLKEYVLKTLKSGQVVPGYGHAVLRDTDPRFLTQRDFAEKFLPDDKLFHIVTKLYKIVPPILKEGGKVKNPWPNVDAHSGVLLYHYGMKEMNYYTVLFGVSRALGALSQVIWDRALGLPIERPKAIELDVLIEEVKKSSKSGGKSGGKSICGK